MVINSVMTSKTSGLLNATNMTQIKSYTPTSQASPRTVENDKSLSTVYSQQYYLKAATSDNTRKAYRSAVMQFEKWGGRLPCSESIIIGYLLDKAAVLNPRTLDLHLSAIKQWHLTQGFNNPTQSLNVSKTIEGIRRVHGKPKQKAKALRLEHIAALIQALYKKPESNKKKRDVALILIAFFGAFRRSELVAITYTDINWEPEGIAITLPQSKTDQTSDGMARSIPYGRQSFCPVLALKHWLNGANILSGPIFRSINRWDQISEQPLKPGSVNHILKALGADCGFDFISELSSHSFRRGLSTSAAREKVDFALIKKQGGWKSDVTVWEYIEEGHQFIENASSILINKIDDLLAGRD
jgi:integrase